MSKRDKCLDTGRQFALLLPTFAQVCLQEMVGEGRGVQRCPGASESVGVGGEGVF